MTSDSFRGLRNWAFPCQEVRELLILQREEIEVCSHVDDLLDHKLATVRGKIAQLEKLKRSLEIASRKCKQDLKKAGEAHRGRCPVLDELSARARTRRNEI